MDYCKTGNIRVQEMFVKSQDSGKDTGWRMYSLIEPPGVKRAHKNFEHFTHANISAEKSIEGMQ